MFELNSDPACLSRQRRGKITNPKEMSRQEFSKPKSGKNTKKIPDYSTTSIPARPGSTWHKIPARKHVTPFPMPSQIDLRNTRKNRPYFSVCFGDSVLPVQQNQARSTIGKSKLSNQYRWLSIYQARTLRSRKKFRYLNTKKPWT